MPLEVRSLPARQGDALWIRWGDGLRRQLLVDMGTEEVGQALRARIGALPEDQRRFELLVVTHVDRDHIGGVLTGLVEPDPLPGFELNDVWFNGWLHLDGRTAPKAGPSLESMGPAQGERLSRWLEKGPWNEAFERGPITRVTGQPLHRIELPEGLGLTVIGPPPERLVEFQPTWKQEVEKALRKGNLTVDGVSAGLERMGSKEPPLLEELAHLEELAASEAKKDRSRANGSSIALVLEHEGKRVLLSGDAFAQDLIDGLHAYDTARPVPLDLFKLPHHGSSKNISDALVEAVECPRWLFSTDGTQFRHPDSIAIARILLGALGPNRKPQPELLFNVPSTFNGWWDNEAWMALFKYTVEYGDPGEGLTVKFGVP